MGSTDRLETSVSLTAVAGQIRCCYEQLNLTLLVPTHLALGPSPPEFASPVAIGGDPWWLEH